MQKSRKEIGRRKRASKLARNKVRDYAAKVERN